MPGKKIDRMSPQTGRVLKEDDSTVNKGDILDTLKDVVGARTASPAANSIGARLKAIMETLTGTLTAQVAGSTLDQRGLAANRPAANAVAIGTTYWSVDTGAIEVSDGTIWRAI